MVLLTVHELEMATGESDNPHEPNEEAASPIPQPQSPSAFSAGNIEDNLSSLPSNRELPPLQRVPPSMITSPDGIMSEMSTEMIVKDAMDAAEQELTECRGDVFGEEMPNSMDDITVANPIEEDMQVTEVNQEVEALINEAKLELDKNMKSAEEACTSEKVKSPDDIIEMAQDQIQQASQTLGNRVAQFFGNHMKKAKSMLHLDEKDGKTTVEEIKDIIMKPASSTGNLTTMTEQKSRTCTIL